MRAALVIGCVGLCAFAPSVRAQPIIIPLSPQAQREPPAPPPPSPVPTAPASVAGQPGAVAGSQANGDTSASAQGGTAQSGGTQPTAAPR